MTILPFPDRKAEVRAERPATRRRHAITIAKSALTFWLVPWLFWLSLIDALDDGADGDGG